MVKFLLFFEFIQSSQDFDKSTLSVGSLLSHRQPISTCHERHHRSGYHGLSPVAPVTRPGLTFVPQRGAVVHSTIFTHQRAWIVSVTLLF